MGLFSKWRRTFIEFSEFRELRESQKSLRLQYKVVQYKDLLCYIVSLWYSGLISVSYTGDPGFQPCNLPFDFFLVTLFGKFSENIREDRKLFVNGINNAHLSFHEHTKKALLVLMTIMCTLL